MSEKVFDISLETIWRRIETDSLSNEFVVFDNFEDTTKVLDFLEVPEYPMRINLNMIILCTEGSLRLRQGVNEIVLSENKFVVILTDQIFQMLEFSPDFKAGFMLVKDEFLLEQNDIRSLLFNIGKAVTWKSCYSISQELMQEESSLFRGIRNTIRQRDNKYRINIIHHYFRIMFYHVCHIFFSEQEKLVEASSRHDEIFYRFIRDVNDEFYQHRKIQYYADKASLTPKYFSKIILEVSGKKASDWIDEYVILEAKTLLKNTSQTIQQISDRLNFSNQSHFSRYFTSHTGVSPYAYRTK
ncbi:helix-turn-helix domain-containing protein [Massilibacteroides vaginae]|uniref:helix-turn-helix domain-containing protein n=1 Tax=Massilibacteroides vaginae TaxID=1673718 RepID=UPI000A1CA210|nr:helix-turn-helix domain-containing protein [Massilibacteroides vaginae]